MANKSFGLFFVGILFATIFLSLTSAVDLSLVSKPLSVSTNAGSFSVVFNVTNTGNTTLTDLSYAITQGTATIVFSEDNFSLTQNGQKQITATVSFASQTGPIAGTITATPVLGTPSNLTFSVSLTQPSDDPVNDFCAYDNGVEGNPGSLRVKVNDITVTGFGDNYEWYPFDEIEVELLVENNGNDDIDNIQVEWGLYDNDQEEWVIEMDDVDEIDLNDDDDDTLTFSFDIDDNMDIDLEDLDSGDHYTLLVRATGDVQNDDDDETCFTTQKDVELIIDKDFVVLSNFDVPETVSCGEDLTITADVWNVGTRDQKDITANVAVKDLNFNKAFDLGDLDSFDSQSVDFIIPIPEDAQEKSYTVNFEVYDDDKDIFENDNNDESKTSRIFKVEGCGTNSGGGNGNSNDVLVSANLESGGKAGDQLVIKTVVTNTGDSQKTFTLNAAGYSEWADNVELSQSSLTLAAGKSGESVLTFDVKKDVSGDKMFNIEVISNKDLVASQPVSVTIQSKSQGLSSLFGDSWYLWVLGIVNVVLVVLIIFVAIRFARKK